MPSTALRARSLALGVITVVLLVFAALSGCTATPTVTTPPASPTPPATSPVAPRPSIAPGTSGVIELDDRPFTLYVGENYRPGTPTTLLVALHGYTADAEGAFAFLGLRRVADERGLLVALPEGTKDGNEDRFWNASSACCDFWGTRVDDSGYLSQVIAEVSAQYAVAARDVAVIGHSNGGFMAYRMACEHADQVGAVVSVAGALDVGGACEPSQPVSVLQVHGSDDQTILFGGGQIEEDRYTSASQTVAQWRELDACPSGPGEKGAALDLDSGLPGDDIVPLDWTGCAAGTRVGLWVVEGGNHSPALTPDFGDAVVDWIGLPA